MTDNEKQLYDALKEACYEMCVRCSGEELCKPCKHLSEDGLHCNAEPGKCFVQRWLNVLAKARGDHHLHNDVLSYDEELKKAQEELHYAENALLDFPSEETSEKYAEALKKLKAIKNRKESNDNGKIQC